MIRIIAICLAVLLVLGLIGPMAYTFVFSAPDDLEQVQVQMELTLTDIMQIETELNAAEEKVRQLTEIINESAGKLEEIDNKTKKAQELMDEYNRESGDRFRAMCERGMMSYLDIIFSSESLADFVDRIVIAKELAEYDRNIMNAIKSVNDELIEEKENTAKYLEEQKTAMAEIESAKAELEKKRTEAKKALEQLEKDEKAYIKYIEDKQSEEDGFRNTYSSTGTLSTSDISSGSFAWPTSSRSISSAFSPSRVNPVSGKILPHTGVDVAGASGDPVIAAAAGRVTFSGVNSGYGNCVMIDHGNGVSTLYAHMSALNVSEGDSVYQGDMIGRVGSTGNSTGPHLHFEIILGGTPVDPMQYF